ncbi:hypothetical protein KXW44_005073 [Aspergillus fumigatus]|nr:hypothetical protein KXX38_004913 [Aspergillus fumigatus]KAH1384578.1 hypothetical protein KXX49_005118 [Aspergillus fumigatus]KAH1913293.1 hypothetical protein KXW47_005748 [Aspergillus fumigatus]KAH2805290.1 hypothetical protein KXV23_000369 [Aspergillus fumigatus]KAH2949309.1 hypothetical protein KXW00_004848 [Aspergillus fumigatus]
MDALSASSVAALHAAFKIKPSNLVHEKYLHPLRDVDPTMRLFQPWQCDKCQILMVGPDTSQLRERILNPEAYYKRYQGQRPPQLEAWVVGIPPTSNSQKRAKRVGALVKLTDILDKDTLRQCPYDTKEPDLNTMVGDSILVKTFGLFPSGGCLDSVTVGMKFAVKYILFSSSFQQQEQSPYPDSTQTIRMRSMQLPSLRFVHTPSVGIPPNDAVYVNRQLTTANLAKYRRLYLVKAPSR